LSSEWNTERVREDASGDSEDGEDDELPCVIGESAGKHVRRSALRGRVSEPKMSINKMSGWCVKTANDIAAVTWCVFIAG